VTKRYHPPQTPCERLLQSDSVPMAAKSKLREISEQLDPLKLLEEMRAVQAYLATLADGETPPTMTPSRPILPRSWQASRAPGMWARSDLLRGIQAALSTRPREGFRARSSCSSHCYPRTDDSDRSDANFRTRSAETAADLRQAWRCAGTGTAHGVADRMQTTGGTSQHQCHAALRRAVHLVPRPLHAQSVQVTLQARQRLAPRRSRT
jgi:hypothetical protein